MRQQAQDIRRPLVQARVPIPALEPDVQQAPCLLKGADLTGCILCQRQEGVLDRFSAVQHEAGRIVVLPDAPHRRLKAAPERSGIGVAGGRVGVPRCDEHHFARHCRRNAAVAAQDELVQRVVGRHGGILRRKAVRILRQRIPLVLRGRIFVDHARQNLPLGAGREIHHLQCRHDAQPSVRCVRHRVLRKDQVGVFTHDLGNQIAAAGKADFVARVEGQRRCPLKAVLHDVRQPRTGQVLAQQHTEHGRLLRVLPRQPRKTDTRIGTGIDQEPPPARKGADLQDDLVPLGLHDALDPPAQRGSAYLMHHAGKHTCVKCHALPPFPRRTGRGLFHTRNRIPYQDARPPARRQGLSRTFHPSAPAQM